MVAAPPDLPQRRGAIVNRVLHPLAELAREDAGAVAPAAARRLREDR